MKNLKYLLVLMTSMALLSCSKGDTGDTGPQGPRGEQGIQGPQGPAGQDGEALGVPGPQGVQGPAGQDGADGQDGVDGEDGNVNVIASDWITTDFEANAANFSSFEVDALGTNINGAFLIYGKRIEIADGGGEFIYPLPHEWQNERYTFLLEQGSGSFPNITPNKIRFTARSVDGTQETFNYFEEVRYVNIPPQPSGKSAIDFSKMTYEEVMNHFELTY